MNALAQNRSGNIDDARSFESYLGRMAINRALDLYRREKRFVPTSMSVEANGAKGFATAASMTGEARSVFWDSVRLCLTRAIPNS